MFKDDEDATLRNAESSLYILEREIEQEINMFSEYLSRVNVESIKSTRIFCKQNKEKFPKLLK